MESKILIYNDLGASADSVSELLAYFDTKKIHAKAVAGHDIQQSDWIENTSLLVMPGGRSLPYYQTLAEKGNKNIISFVKQGGVYLGLCAGAYYACHETIFAEGLPNELILPGALNFFHGKAIGPVFGAKDFAYQSEQGAQIVSIGVNHQSYSVYFNGGCYFEPALENQIIARYEENGLPAIIKLPVENGLVVLSGVHPELSYKTIPDDNNGLHKYLRESMQPHDSKRLMLMNMLLSFSGIEQSID